MLRPFVRFRVISEWDDNGHMLVFRDQTSFFGKIARTDEFRRILVREVFEGFVQ